MECKEINRIRKINGFETYKNIFMESDKCDYQDYTILHNCDCGSSRLKFVVFDMHSEKYNDDYIILTQESFDLIYNMIVKYIPGFDIYDCANPIKPSTLEYFYEDVLGVIDDLENERITKNLTENLGKLWFETKENETNIECAFRNKKTIIDFLSALIWYLIKECDLVGEAKCEILNIIGY